MGVLLDSVGSSKVEWGGLAAYSSDSRWLHGGNT
jgi:hypothetical protein